jgi:hypothetical protein
VIIPVGYRNRFQHPRPEVVERYAGQPGVAQRIAMVRYACDWLDGGLSPCSSYRSRSIRRYWHGQ